MPFPLDVPKRIAHVDLKGVQCRPNDILASVERFRALGYDALLVEYEDVFPYATGRLSMDPEEVWTRDFLAEFLAKAEFCGLEIIPLQQCLGHLEYLLRWDAFASLRLPCGFPSTLNVESREARCLLNTMLSDMIESHPRSRFVHLGMDDEKGVSSSTFTSSTNWAEKWCAKKISGRV